MTVVPVKTGSDVNEIVIVAESDKSSKMDLVAYQWDLRSDPTSKILVSLKKAGNGLQLLEGSADGRYISGALNDRLFLGSIVDQEANDVSQLQYNFFSFDAPDLVTAVDMRVHKRNTQSSKKSKVEANEVVDIIMGGARGGIYLYHDAISRCQAENDGTADADSLHAQKYHWHRKAVHAVKWSRDGNYMISGGSENSLVIWQMDTSKKDFLPHLSGSVENIVVSKDGSSYVVHLDDNSTMVLSTAELRPTTYISGIQSAVTDSETPKDLLVKRVWGVAESVQRPVPAAIRATDSSKLHVCVGNGRQATMSGNLSAPLLQTIDLETFSSVSRQALARTQPTDLNLNSKGHTIDEPLVTHVNFSGDGRWLASVDDWQPPARDIEHVTPELREQFIRERREVHLKFWQVQEGSDSIALVSRVNGPHSTSSAISVFDLAADPSSTCFATIGGDGMVRLWRPRTRLQNGIPVRGAGGKDVQAWNCSDIIAVGDGFGSGAVADMSTSEDPTCQGKVTFSEDGSTILAAFGNADSGSVYIIDASTGRVVKTLDGLWEGKLHSIQILSQYIICLSKDLRVYDIVSDELRYGITISQAPNAPDLLQLAVDSTSGHFAITLPTGDSASIGIFSPEYPEPLLVRRTPQRIVSLTASPDASGFLALDDAAQIWTITEGSDSKALVTAQPLQDLNLDGPDSLVEDGVNLQAMQNGDDALMDADEDEDEDADDDNIEELANDEMDLDDDDFAPSVINQQSLADIFNAAPAFAAPSIEDMFYKVTGLLSTKPLSAADI